MQTVLSSGEEFIIDIVMMASNMPSTLFGLVFAEANMYCCEIEWLFCEPQNFLSIVLAFSTFFSQCNAMGSYFCLLYLGTNF